MSCRSSEFYDITLSFFRDDITDSGITHMTFMGLHQVVCYCEEHTYLLQPGDEYTVYVMARQRYNGLKIWYPNLPEDWEDLKSYAEKGDG